MKLPVIGALIVRPVHGTFWDVGEMLSIDRPGRVDVPRAVPTALVRVALSVPEDVRDCVSL